MINEAFASGSSLIHRIDPRLRIIFATIFSFTVALATQFTALTAALFFSVILLCMAELNRREVIKRLYYIWGILFLLWIVLPATFAGEPIYHIGPIIFTRPGVILSLQITLKTNIIFLIFITMIATMDIATMGYALATLKVPEKIVHLLILTYRYIFVLETEYQKIIRAAKVRGFCPGTNMHTYKTYAYIVGMLFVRASERAKRVHQAMKCRGFRGKFYSLHNFYILRKDWIWATLMSLCIFLIVILELADGKYIWLFN